MASQIEGRRDSLQHHQVCLLPRSPFTKGILHYSSHVNEPTSSLLPFRRPNEVPAILEPRIGLPLTFCFLDFCECSTTLVSHTPFLDCMEAFTSTRSPRPQQPKPPDHPPVQGLHFTLGVSSLGGGDLHVVLLHLGFGAALPFTRWGFRCLRFGLERLGFLLLGRRWSGGVRGRVECWAF